MKSLFLLAIVFFVYGSSSGFLFRQRKLHTPNHIHNTQRHYKPTPPSHRRNQRGRSRQYPEIWSDGTRESDDNMIASEGLVYRVIFVKPPFEGRQRSHSGRKTLVYYMVPKENSLQEFPDANESEFFVISYDKHENVEFGRLANQLVQSPNIDDVHTKILSHMAWGAKIYPAIPEHPENYIHLPLQETNSVHHHHLAHQSNLLYDIVQKQPPQKPSFRRQSHAKSAHPEVKVIDRETVHIRSRDFNLSLTRTDDKHSPKTQTHQLPVAYPLGSRMDHQATTQDTSHNGRYFPSYRKQPSSSPTYLNEAKQTPTYTNYVSPQQHQNFAQASAEVVHGTHQQSGTSGVQPSPWQPFGGFKDDIIQLPDIQHQTRPERPSQETVSAPPDHQRPKYSRPRRPTGNRRGTYRRRRVRAGANRRHESDHLRAGFQGNTDVFHLVEDDDLSIKIVPSKNPEQEQAYHDSFSTFTTQRPSENQHFRRKSALTSEIVSLTPTLATFPGKTPMLVAARPDGKPRVRRMDSDHNSQNTTPPTEAKLEKTTKSNGLTEQQKTAFHNIIEDKVQQQRSAPKFSLASVTREFRKLVL